MSDLSDAGINWLDIDVMSDAGVNWLDLDVLSDAGINWLDLECSFGYGDQLAGFGCVK